MLLLFCFYLLPGVIYAIWRYTGLKSACAMCGSDNVIPSNSVVAQQIIADRDEAQLEVNCPFCKEKIKPDAIKCKHCGSALGATPTPS